MQPLQETKPAASPPHLVESDAGRCFAKFGEFIISSFEGLSESRCACLMTGREAAKAGLRGAFCRVVLAFGLPIACLYAALGYEQAVQWLGDLMDLSSEGHHTTAQIGFAVLFAVPAVIWSAFLLLSDADDKWRRLHWLYFCLFAVILLSCYGPMLLLLAAVGVHFAFHLSIHAAFQLRDKEAEYDDVK